MSRIPKTDSIATMARFWDTHDLTEFEGELKEVNEAVFVREAGPVLRLRLEPAEAEVLHHLARQKGVDDATLASEWIAEKLHAS